MHNLRQIGLGLILYESANGSLPPAYTVDPEGRPLHSWRTLILPYMEGEELYQSLDLTKPWNDPVNQAAYYAQDPVEMAGEWPQLTDVGPPCRS